MCNNNVTEFDMNSMVILPIQDEARKYIYTIDEALTYMLENDRLYYLSDMVEYNVPIRDAIRSHGIRAVADKLLKFSPYDEKLKKSIEHVVYEFADCQLADFDIQVLPISANLHLYGEQVKFKQLCECIEMTRRVDMFTSECKRGNDTLNVALLYEPYPCFDSDDYASETRRYENYIIRNYMITEGYCIEIEKGEHLYNANFVVESLSLKYLPMIYHNGDSRFMLVATAKDNPQVTPEELSVMIRKRRSQKKKTESI